MRYNRHRLPVFDGVVYSTDDAIHAEHLIPSLFVVPWFLWRYHSLFECGPRHIGYLERRYLVDFYLREAQHHPELRSHCVRVASVNHYRRNTLTHSVRYTGLPEWLRSTMVGFLTSKMHPFRCFTSLYCSSETTRRTHPRSPVTAE